MRTISVASRNRGICYALDFMWAMHLGVALTTVFYTLAAGLTILEMFGILAVAALVSATMEIFFGWVADKIGVKRVMVCGLALQVVQSWLFPQADSLGEFMGVMVLNSISWSMTSGTSPAIVAASSAPDDSARFNRIAPAFRGLGGFTAGVIGAWLVDSYGVTTPFVVQPLIFLIGFALALLIVDKQSTKKHADRHAFKYVWAVMFHQHRNVRWFMLLSATISSAGAAMTLLAQPDMEDAGYTVATFSVLYLVRTGTVTGLALVNNLLSKYLRDSKVQFCLLLVVAGSALFAGVTSWKPSVYVLLVGIALDFALTQAMVANAINGIQQLENYRATAQSAFGALKATASISVIGVGFLCEVTSVDTALLWIGILTACIGGYCFCRYLREEKLVRPH